MNGNKTAISLAIGSAFAVSLSAIPAAQADNTPFGMRALNHGYMVADAKAPEGKCGGMKEEGMKAKEGKCGNQPKMKDGKCGEGKCGAGMKKKADDQSKDGKK